MNDRDVTSRKRPVQVNLMRESDHDCLSNSPCPWKLEPRQPSDLSSSFPFVQQRLLFLRQESHKYQQSFVFKIVYLLLYHSMLVGLLQRQRFFCSPWMSSCVDKKFCVERLCGGHILFHDPPQSDRFNFFRVR